MSINLNFDKADSSLYPYSVVVDVETTGLPTEDGTPTKAKLKADPDCYPRIVQIAWIVLSEDGKVVSKAASYIKQKKPIPRQATAIHGITTDHANLNGRELKSVLSEFSRQIEYCDVLVAYNVQFDQYTIEAECLRVGIPKPFKSKTKFCAMKKAEPITGRKFTKLEKAVETLGVKFENPLPDHVAGHNAELDCVHAACIYLYLKR
jgi:DNA polymerase III epsilon subunit-like protein